MTTLREAAQQALEALEAADVDPHSSDAVYKAITALKAALADPVQEPVAWMMVNETYATACERKLMWKPAKNWHPTWEAVPLYTSPPQRKPLTDEEIEQIADGIPVDDFVGPTTWHLKLSRAIERAHGIGGNDE